MLSRFIAFSMIKVHGYCSCNIFDDLFKCLQFLKVSRHAIFKFPFHLQEILEKNKKYTVFLWKIMAKVFLNHLFLLFNSRIIVDFIFANSPYPKKLVEFYFAKMSSVKIQWYLGKRVQCILFLKCIDTPD